MGERGPDGGLPAGVAFLQDTSRIGEPPMQTSLMQGMVSSELWSAYPPGAAPARPQLPTPLLSVAAMRPCPPGQLLSASSQVLPCSSLSSPRPIFVPSVNVDAFWLLKLNSRIPSFCHCPRLISAGEAGPPPRPLPTLGTHPGPRTAHWLMGSRGRDASRSSRASQPQHRPAHSTLK